MSRTLSSPKREGGISLETPQRKRASSHVQGRISCFFLSCAGNLSFLSSYGRNFRATLVWAQESPVSMRVARGLLGFLSSHCRGRRPHLELRLEPQDSSPVLTWISGFLWSFHRGVRPRLVRRHASLPSSLVEKQWQASCRVDIWIGGFLSRCHIALTTTIKSCVDPRVDHQVSAWESGVSRVDWDIGVF